MVKTGMFVDESTLRSIAEAFSTGDTSKGRELIRQSALDLGLPELEGDWEYGIQKSGEITAPTWPRPWRDDDLLGPRNGAIRWIKAGW